MLSPELRDKILQVIKSSITIEQFEDWFVSRLPLFLESPNSLNANVIAAVELGLAEMTDGIRTRDEFLALLRSVLQEEGTTLDFSSPELDVSESSNQTSQHTLDFTATVTAPL